MQYIMYKVCIATRDLSQVHNYSNEPLPETRWSIGHTIKRFSTLMARLIKALNQYHYTPKTQSVSIIIRLYTTIPYTDSTCT